MRARRSGTKPRRRARSAAGARSLAAASTPARTDEVVGRAGPAPSSSARCSELRRVERGVARGRSPPASSQRRERRPSSRRLDGRRHEERRPAPRRRMRRQPRHAARRGPRRAPAPPARKNGTSEPTAAAAAIARPRATVGAPRLQRAVDRGRGVAAPAGEAGGDRDRASRGGRRAGTRPVGRATRATAPGRGDPAKDEVVRPVERAGRRHRHVEAVPVAARAARG